MSNLIEFIQSVFKILFSAYIMYYFGVLQGILIIISVFIGYRLFMKIIFGLEMLNTFDKSFVGDLGREKINILSLITFKTFDEEKIKNLFKDNLISKISKFQKRIVYKFGNYYWKKVTLEESFKRIKTINGINSDHDFMNYANSQLNNHIDIWNNLPYEIEIIPYKGEGGAILWKFDHTLTDGLGLVNTICCLADNFDINVFPKILRINEYKWYVEIFEMFSFIYYGPIALYYFLKKHVKYSPSPFRKYPTSGKSKCYHSKFYQIDSLEKVRKGLKMSFNDIMMSITSKTFNIIKNKSDYNGLYKDLKNSNILVPVGRRSLPSSIRNSKLSNNFSLVYAQLPLIYDIPKQFPKITNSLRTHLGNPGGIYALKITLTLIYEFLPRILQLYVQETLSLNIDMIFSNVPGPSYPIYLAGCKMESVGCMVSNSRFPAFVMVYSYNNKFQFFITSDENSGINNKEFITQMEEELDILIDGFNLN